jgi:hypothetical protein
MSVVFRLEFDWIFQVDVARKNTSFSPLSLRERARVRGSCFGFPPYTKKTPD